MRKFLVVLLALIAVGSLAGNALLYLRYSTQRPLMRIGSESIQIKDYRDKIDFEYGKPVLTKMAYTMLVLQEAKKANVMPTDDDVKNRIAIVERRVPKMLEPARNDPAKMAQLKADLRTEIALENLTIKDVKVTDAELRAYYTKNKNMFLVPAQARTTIVLAEDPVDAKTAEALLKNKNMTPDVISNQPRLRVVGVRGTQINWNTVPASFQNELSQAIFKLPVGGVTTVRAGQGKTGMFVIARVDGRENSGIESFETVRPTLERALRLEKASKSATPQQVLARLYKGANVKFEVSKYAEYFKEIEAEEKATKTNTDAQKGSSK